MAERQRPTEAEQRQPEPVRIFSGAKMKNGKLEKPIHQMLYDLWLHERDWGRVPGTLRVMTAAGSDIDPTMSLRVNPKNKAAKKIIEDTRGRFEQGVKEWVEKGSPPYANVSEFRDEYIKPLEQKR